MLQCLAEKVVGAHFVTNSLFKVFFGRHLHILPWFSPPFSSSHRRHYNPTDGFVSPLDLTPFRSTTQRPLYTLNVERATHVAPFVFSQQRGRDFPPPLFSYPINRWPCVYICAHTRTCIDTHNTLQPPPFPPKLLL